MNDSADQNRWDMAIFIVEWVGLLGGACLFALGHQAQSTLIMTFGGVLFSLSLCAEVGIRVSLWLSARAIAAQQRTRQTLRQGLAARKARRPAMTKTPSKRAKTKREQS